MKFLRQRYYNKIRHPTCVNFRDSSKRLIESWIRGLAIAGPICEVGCGSSLAAESLSDIGYPLDRLLLTDSSLSMLSFSEQWGSAGANLLLANASELPFADNSIQVCIASLGDPYNSPLFWREMARIIKPLGCVLFTTPSHDWASRYRSSQARSVAEFVLADGRDLWVPSEISAVPGQISLIQESGRLHVESVQSVTYSQVPSSYISDKLSVVKEGDLPVVTGYLAFKVV